MREDCIIRSSSLTVKFLGLSLSKRNVIAEQDERQAEAGTPAFCAKAMTPFNSLPEDDSSASALTCTTAAKSHTACHWLHSSMKAPSSNERLLTGLHVQQSSTKAVYKVIVIAQVVA